MFRAVDRVEQPLESFRTHRQDVAGDVESAICEMNEPDSLVDIVRIGWPHGVLSVRRTPNACINPTNSWAWERCVIVIVLVLSTAASGRTLRVRLVAGPESRPTGAVELHVGPPPYDGAVSSDDVLFEADRARPVEIAEHPVGVLSELRNEIVLALLKG